MRISDWSSDVCSSDLTADRAGTRRRDGRARPAREILGRCQQGRVPFDGMTTLFHISDLHFGLEDPAALAWVADCVRREAPAAVLVTGDLTMRARSREFAAACDWIGALDVPVTVEVGNHDLPYFRSEEHTSELQSLMRTSYA